ncbi:glycosyltransferase family 4 protein [Sutcliffiella horikoshii]|uniref:glycosyltransferase family 4 protein n=1 Tax=Sutcliffiella horikoshii TaxID=79883 RepID=UPI001CFD2412|nr:glycosyltransferase family 4 protein [Sutcliffiella horikoshii]
MKILVVCQYYYPEPFRISDICESLVEMGHSVTVLTGLPNYPEGQVLDGFRNGKKRNEVLNGVKVIRSFEIGRGNNKLRLFLNYLSFALSGSLKAFFMKEKFDVVYVNQLSPVMMGIPAIVYKRRHKKKLLLYCLDLWPDSLAAGGIKESSTIYKFFMKISQWIYNSADCIAVTSSMFEEYFISTLGVYNKKIHHIPQYAEDLFTESIEVAKGDKYNFVFAGNIGDMQSVETIVKAANVLREHSNIIFHIVGDGSKLEECKLLSKKMGLENVIYYGRRPVSEMPHYYGSADAMLITLKNNKAISYTLPGKVQSYMAAGKPIIGAINGETNRVIKDAECGLCCTAENYSELANLIIQFCNSNEKEKMAQNSYEYYINNYSKERFMLVLEDTLTNLEG